MQATHGTVPHGLCASTLTRDEDRLESDDPQQITTDRNRVERGVKSPGPPGFRLGEATSVAARTWPFDPDVANSEFAGEVPLGDDAAALSGGYGEGS